MNSACPRWRCAIGRNKAMALPKLNSRDERIRYFELMLAGDLAEAAEIPLPAGYRYAPYQPGDREDWLAILLSAGELKSIRQGLAAWKRFFEAHERELPARMCFVENQRGEKVAAATAFFDIRGIDQSGDGWLHWVAVRREDQGRGLSKPLISHVAQIMKALGHTRAKIPTQTTSWVAVKVYLDLGFRPVEKNLVNSREGWRIIKRLTNHPALSLPPAEDSAVLETKYQKMAEELMEALAPCRPWQYQLPGTPYFHVYLRDRQGRIMSLLLEEELTLFFGSYHCHYSLMGEGSPFAELKREALAITSGRCFVYSADAGKHWAADGLCEKGTGLKGALLQEFRNRREMKEGLVTVRCVSWNEEEEPLVILLPRDFSQAAEAEKGTP